MDAFRFDQLSKSIGTQRRTVLGGMLAGLLLPLASAALGKNKGRKQKGKGKQRTNAQAEPCWRAGECIVSKGSNVSQCDLAGYVAPDGLDCTRCNLSRANLHGADLTGVNFTRANLSGACLVNADLTGAIVTNTTNLYNAIFCNTRMPDGSINNSGCGNGTACCPTAGQCSPGGCPTRQRCCDGTCVTGICCANADCQPTGNQCLSAGGGPTFCACGLGSSCSGATPDCCPTNPGLNGDQGFCTNLQTDLANCGRCGNACASRPCNTVTCNPVTGACEYTPTPGAAGTSCPAPLGDTNDAICQPNGRCCVPNGGDSGGNPPDSCDAGNCCSLGCYIPTTTCV